MKKRISLKRGSGILAYCTEAAERVAELYLPLQNAPRIGRYAVACALFERFAELRAISTTTSLFSKPNPDVLVSARSEIAPVLSSVTLDCGECIGGSHDGVLRPDALAAIYESEGSRRERGAYYTPEATARMMTLGALERYLCVSLPDESESGIKHLIDQSDASGLSNVRAVESALARVRILDPACGGGAFLIAMFTELRRLLSAVTDGAVPENGAVVRSIHGIDSDPLAVSVARMRLALACGTLPASLESNTRCADAFDVPDMDGTFDIVLANPPYISTYARGASELDGELALRERYPEAGGRLNAFGCFTMRGMDFVGDRGVLAYIVPDVLAYASSYSGLRSAVAQRMPWQEWVLPDGRVFDATVRSVILLASAGPRSIKTSTVPSNASVWSGADVPFRGSVADGVRFFRSDAESDLWTHIRSLDATVRDLFFVKDGVNPGPAACRAMILDDVDPHAPSSRRYIEGKDIDPNGWFVRPADKWLRYDQSLKNTANAAQGFSLRNAGVFQSPKLVYRQTADTLVVALDERDDLVTLNSVHCIRSKTGDAEELLALLTILNSPLARLFYAVDSSETRDVLPQVHVSWLNQFRLPDAFCQAAPVLSAIARDVLAGDDTAPARLHSAVCEAYCVDSSPAGSVLSAYFDRYPRFRFA